MKRRDKRLYNVILPLWLLLAVPPLVLLVIPANLAVDCLVLLLTLAWMKRGEKAAVLRRLWWKFWLLGFAADAVGAAWMFLGVLPGIKLTWWSDTVGRIMYNAFSHPAALLWTLAGVVLAGVCIYFFDRRAMASCALLTARERHQIALSMAVFTAPWLFFVPTLWYF